MSTLEQVEEAISAAENRAANHAKHCVALHMAGGSPCYDGIGFDNLRRLVKDLANEGQVRDR